MKSFEVTKRVLDCLDGFSPWAFTGSMYLARWAIVVPLAYVLGQLGVPNRGARFDGSPLVLLFGFILLAPLLETLVECVVPYWLMMRLKLTLMDKRPWKFVAISSLLMALLHISAWPAAILPSLVTGGFLAYTYSHFAVGGVGQALLHTCAFHAAINLVGWLFIFVS